MLRHLVDLLDGGAVIATVAGSATGGTSSSGHAAGTWSSTGLVELHHDGVGNSLKPKNTKYVSIVISQKMVDEFD